MQENEKPSEVKIKIGEIEIKKIDLNQYIGKREKIVSQKIYQGVYGYYLKVETTVIDVIPKGKENIELKASRMFSLFENDKGSIGWGKDTELGLFLTAKRVKTPEELVGKEVIVQITEPNKKGQTFLTFI